MLTKYIQLKLEEINKLLWCPSGLRGRLTPSGLIILKLDTSESMVDYNWPLYEIICCRRSVVERALGFKKRSHREETYLKRV